LGIAATWLGTVASLFAVVGTTAGANATGETLAGNVPAAGWPDGNVRLNSANNTPRSAAVTLPSPLKSPWLAV
jgi:large exoprotein involved in heme utilization and adhesion